MLHIRTSRLFICQRSLGRLGIRRMSGMAQNAEELTTTNGKIVAQKIVDTLPEDMQQQIKTAKSL